jgi:hypothetical protein
MFWPENAPQGAAQLRFAFANLDSDGIAVLFARLASLDL